MPDSGVPGWLPPLDEVYGDVVENPKPEGVVPPAVERVQRAINELRAAGAPVTDRVSLIRYLVTSTLAVQRGDGGFDLSYEDQQAIDACKPVNPEAREDAEVESSVKVEQEAVPAGAIRVFYGGWVVDPGQPDNDESEVPARHIAERVAAECSAAGHHAVTLEQLGYAAIIDRLNLWEDDEIRNELNEPLEWVMAEFPDWAERVRDKNGNLKLKNFAGIVWREGLSTQYAAEADGEAVVVNAKPFPAQTWYMHERPALVANERVDTERVYQLGHTHPPASVRAGGDKRPKPLAEFTGPMTDAQSMEFIRAHEEARERERTGISEFVQYPTKRTDDISPEDAKELGDRATEGAKVSRATENLAAQQRDQALGNTHGGYPIPEPFPGVHLPPAGPDPNNHGPRQ